MTTRTTALVALAAFVLIPPETDAGPRRPPKPVEYFRFSPEHLVRKLEAFEGEYDRFTLVNEMDTMVSGSGDLCKLEWNGRRVEYYTGPADSLSVAILSPAHGHLESLDVYRVAADGTGGNRLDETEIVTIPTNRALVVRVENVAGWPVIDVQYRFEAETFGIDDSFVFRQAWPTLRAEYWFGIDPTLWHTARDAGHDLEFQALAHPRTWYPTRASRSDRMAWYWRKLDIDPTASGTPDSLNVSGMLPAAVVYEFEQEELEKALAQRGIRDVRVEFIEHQLSYSKGSKGLRERYQNSRPEDYGLEVPVAPPKRVAPGGGADRNRPEST